MRLFTTNWVVEAPLLAIRVQEPPQLAVVVCWYS